jgi:hypothetical protein
MESSKFLSWQRGPAHRWSSLLGTVLVYLFYNLVSFPAGRRFFIDTICDRKNTSSLAVLL